MHKSSSRNISIFLTGFILLAWFTLMPSSICVAGLHELSEAEMAQINGAGFSSFTWSTVGLQDIIRADFNIETRTYAEIASIKMGYYGGWDQDWTGVKLGTPATDLVASGVYIEAGYDTATINNATTRTLNYIKIGTSSLAGSIAANFNSLSSINGAGVYSGRANLGPQTYSSATGQEFYILLQTGAVAGTQPGFWVHWNGVMP